MTLIARFCAALLPGLLLALTLAGSPALAANNETVAAELEAIIKNGEDKPGAAIADASWLLVAIPNSFEAGEAIAQARLINPAIRVIARAHSDDEVHFLTRQGADTVIMGEREIALGMLAETTGAPA